MHIKIIEQEGKNMKSGCPKYCNRILKFNISYNKCKVEIIDFFIWLINVVYSNEKIK